MKHEQFSLKSKTFWHWLTNRFQLRRVCITLDYAIVKLVDGKLSIAGFRLEGNIGIDGQ